MTGFGRVSLVALLLSPLAASAQGYGGVVSSYYSPVYYRPAVAYYAPAVAYYTPVVSYSAPVWPVYAAPAVCYPTAAVYAVPTAAPPSQTVEPPAYRPSGAAPRITESEGHQAKKVGGPATADRVQVGFWNVTGRDVTLTIDGQARTLRRNRSLTLTVSRQFSWGVDQRPAQTERVPEGHATLEIVVRE